MKRKLMVSVLLAGLAAAIPVYAADDRIPDEYDPEAKYESPLSRPFDPAVNDYRVVRAEDGNEKFAKTAGTLTQAPVKKAGKQTQKEEEILPLVITGDDAQYASESGDFIIEGNVSLRQGTTRLASAKAVGNAKSGDVWLLEGGMIQDAANQAEVHWAHYNFNQKTGELLHIKGVSNPTSDDSKHDYYEAPHGIIENGMLTIDRGGMLTRCPAVKHSPCLSVKAKTITIIPNDRIIAKDVKVFAKGKHIYSRNIWVNNLKGGKSEIVPHAGWKSDHGWYVGLDYEHPIGSPLLKNPTRFSIHQVFYTESKYKPFYSIRHDQRDFYVRLNDGYVYDSDNDLIDDGIWLHKKTDWGLFLKPHRIAKGIPVTVDAGITHGLWKYANENWSSWHTETAVNLRHDRIHLFGGKKLFLDLRAGYKWVKESLDDALTREHGKNLNTGIYHGTIGYRFSDKWNIWETYHHEHKTSYLFSLGQPDFSKEWRTGIAWSPDKHNTLTIVNRHNSDKGSGFYGNYSTKFSWSHRFCCEGFTVSYERKHYNHENEWNVSLNLYNW